MTATMMRAPCISTVRRRLRGATAGLVALVALALGACSTIDDPTQAVKAASGPAPTLAVTQMEEALRCLSENYPAEADLRLGVNDLTDGTGATMSGDTFSKVLTQRPDVMMTIALAKTGSRVVNRSSTGVSEWELKQAMQKYIGDGRAAANPASKEHIPYRPILAGSVLGSTHYVSGAISELNWNLNSDASEVGIGGFTFGSRNYRISIGIDLIVTNTLTTEVVMARSYSKQLVGKETSAGLFRFFEVGRLNKNFGGKEVFEFNLGKQANEPVQTAVRWIIETAAYEIVSGLSGVGGVCDERLPEASRPIRQFVRRTPAAPVARAPVPQTPPRADVRGVPQPSPAPAPQAMLNAMPEMPSLTPNAVTPASKPRAKPVATAKAPTASGKSASRDTGKGKSKTSATASAKGGTAPKSQTAGAAKPGGAQTRVADARTQAPAAKSASTHRPQNGTPGAATLAAAKPGAGGVPSGGAKGASGGAGGATGKASTQPAGAPSGPPTWLAGTPASAPQAPGIAPVAVAPVSPVAVAVAPIALSPAAANSVPAAMGAASGPVRAAPAEQPKADGAATAAPAVAQARVQGPTTQGPASPGPIAQGPTNFIEGVNLIEDDSEIVVRVDLRVPLSELPPIEPGTQDSLVLVFAQVRNAVGEILNLNGKGVSGVRLTEAQGATRLAIDLTTRVDYNIDRNGRSLLITLKPATGGTAQSDAPKAGPTRADSGEKPPGAAATLKGSVEGADLLAPKPLTAVTSEMMMQSAARR